jgi:hypothetical protein
MERTDEYSIKQPRMMYIVALFAVQPEVRVTLQRSRRNDNVTSICKMVDTWLEPRRKDYQSSNLG